MNRHFLVAICAVIVCSTRSWALESGDRERAFVKALERFDTATSPDDYRESAHILESILADGYVNGAVYYNLGNAYYRTGEFGRAILNYRKAVPYRPRDPYLTANLEQALIAAPGRLHEPERMWWSHVLFWTDWISFPAKVRWLFGGLILAAVTACAAVLLRRPRLQIITAVLLFCSAAIGVDTWLCYDQVVNSTRAVITGETIARKGMGQSYDAAFDQPLRDGAEFRVLSEVSGWVFGHFESIGDGWVQSEFVAR
ncbi:tetratricopeptide repeat protein [Schlesneria paludicola]|uniref:tetratricopeptide repeat protein n=1 Tax=Schlesneria paludicola TaxID=360056 RepID=UPI00029B3ED5|nr:tetratricopeptide repeat protein [Schlesneria paludicola]